MADDPRTGKEDGEEEEEQEGKGTDSTVNDSGSASRTVTDSEKNDPPDSAQSLSQNVSPLATQTGSQYTGSGSPSLRKSPSKSGVTSASYSLRRTPSRSEGTTTVAHSLGRTPSRSEGTSTVAHSLGRTPSRSEGTSTVAQSLGRTPSRSEETSRIAQSLRQSPSRSYGLSSDRKTDASSSVGGSLRKSPSKSLVTSHDSQSLRTDASPRTGASSRSTQLEYESRKGPSETESEYVFQDGQSETESTSSVSQSMANIPKTGVVSRKGSSKAPRKDKNVKGQSRAHQPPACGSSRLFERRSPFVHNPPYPEERRSRISHPQCPKDYIINLREDLADFQESHGLPRTRDYSFMSLGLSLAQETGRAIYSVFLMITELFPVIAIVSLILRFALDKVIDILETDGTVPRLKKTVLFALQIIIILIPLWILVGTIIIPMFYLILSIFRRLFHLSGRKPGKAKTTPRPTIHAAPKTKKKKIS